MKRTDAAGQADALIGPRVEQGRQPFIPYSVAAREADGDRAGGRLLAKGRRTAARFCDTLCIDSFSSSTGERYKRASGL